MAGHGHPKFGNDHGVPEIRIGVKEFNCIGVSPPHDHPHIYLDVGNNDRILCLLRDPHRPTLGSRRGRPAGLFVH